MKKNIKNWVKTTITITILLIAVVLFLNIVSSRFEKIENGEMVVVSESQMAERK